MDWDLALWTARDRKDLLGKSLRNWGSKHVLFDFFIRRDEQVCGWKRETDKAAFCSGKVKETFGDFYWRDWLDVWKSIWQWKRSIEKSKDRILGPDARSRPWWDRCSNIGSNKLAMGVRPSHQTKVSTKNLHTVARVSFKIAYAEEQHEEQ